ncbi:MAG: alpha-ketoglutarate decarboxylase [Salinimicrobium sp.]
MTMYLSNKKSLFFPLIFILISHSYIFGQKLTTTESHFLDHVRFGGSLGLSFSNKSFSGYLAPKAVYDFNSYFSAGLGTMGSYTDGSNYTAWTAGGSLIGLARPLPALQFSTEFEENYVSRKLEFDGGNINDTYWKPALFLGLGYITGNITVGMRYDLLHDDEKSIYANAFMPFVSILF